MGQPESIHEVPHHRRRRVRRLARSSALTPRVLALLATIPPRRASCERLLQELVKQSRPPDAVILCLDGYGDAPAPACPLPVVRTYRTPVFSGPGQRWRVACDFAPEDILIAIDDDLLLDQAPRFVEALAGVVSAPVEIRFQERFGQVAIQLVAAAAMGYTPEGRRAGPGAESRGRLVVGCGCGLAVRAGHLEGLQALAAEVRAAGGPDALGLCGDDQALVSAHLWRRGVPIVHAATGPLSFAPGTQRESQTRARQVRGEKTLFEQAQAIARITGWPFPAPVVEVEEQPALSWEEELSAVPRGAHWARGAAPPAGHRRVLVVDEGEPERSGVYDVPHFGPDRPKALDWDAEVRRLPPGAGSR